MHKLTNLFFKLNNSNNIGYHYFPFNVDYGKINNIFIDFLVNENDESSLNIYIIETDFYLKKINERNSDKETIKIGSIEI